MVKQRYEALLQEIKKEYLDKDKKETIEGSFQIFSGKAFRAYRPVSGGGGPRRGGSRPGTEKPAHVTAADIAASSSRRPAIHPSHSEGSSIQMDGDIFCRNGELNRMRREALEKLMEQCTAGTRRTAEGLPEARMSEKAEGGSAKKSQKSAHFPLRTVGTGGLSERSAGFPGGASRLSDQRKAGFPETSGVCRGLP